MLPCRNSAYRFIKTLLALSPNAQVLKYLTLGKKYLIESKAPQAPKGRVDNMSRFREEF
jgi:hypothetical protein